MAIRIITDSASEIDQNEFTKVQVEPLSVTFDEVTYKDGIDITKDEFYDKLETIGVPKTSLISPLAFMNLFEEVKKSGDEAIVITLSSGLSGTYQSAMIAATDFDNISVIDSKNVTVAEKILVKRAMELNDGVRTREEIVKILEEEKEKIVLYAVIDTIKYLLIGGRISKTSAVMANALDIKPICTMEEGKLVSISKSLGTKKSFIFIKKSIETNNGIDLSKPYSFAYTGKDKENLLEFIEFSKKFIDYQNENFDITQVGSTVGTHAGPGAFCIAYFKN